MLNRFNFISGINTIVTVVSHVQRPQLPRKGQVWRFDNMISEFWAYFHCAWAETAI